MEVAVEVPSVLLGFPPKIVYVGLFYFLIAFLRIMVVIVIYLLHIFFPIFFLVDLPCTPNILCT